MLFIVAIAQNKTNIKNENLTNWMNFKTTSATTAEKLSCSNTPLLLGEYDELQLISTQKDFLNFKHYRYQQNYKGIPVEGAVYLIHEKNEKVQTANGKLVHHLKVDVNPILNEKQALSKALKFVNAESYAWEDPSYKELYKRIIKDDCYKLFPKGYLVIVNSEFTQKASNHYLAFKFDIYATEPSSRKIVYVDACNGNILTAIEKINTCTNVNASGATAYSGNQNFIACKDTGAYILKSNIGVETQVFSANNTISYLRIPISDENNFFNVDPVANEVHWATQKTYEYFLNTHNRNSLDDEGMELINVVHYGEGYNSAFWNGYWMTYCDGDNSLHSSFASPDVVGHEMTHGVTEFSAGLKNYGEPGALNESFSDIFGEVVENYMRGSNDWLMGADFTILHTKSCIRNLKYPNDPKATKRMPDTYYGDFWQDVSVKCNSDNDKCGVHYNCGVQNYWFYLLCEGGSGINDFGYEYTVESIGMEKAAAIAYRNLTVYLTGNAKYIDARNGAVQAAKDLFGADSNEVEQTIAAWCAVGLGNCTLDLENGDCPDYLNQTGVVTDGIFQAKLNFNSNAIVPHNNSVQFKAGEQIKLESGFSTVGNAEFEAEIEGCN